MQLVRNNGKRIISSKGWAIPPKATREFSSEDWEKVKKTKVIQHFLKVKELEELSAPPVVEETTEESKKGKATENSKKGKAPEEPKKPEEK